jgi:hypothetical protein
MQIAIPRNIATIENTGWHLCYCRVGLRAQISPRRTPGITEHEKLTLRKSETEVRVLRVHAIVRTYCIGTWICCGVRGVRFQDSFRRPSTNQRKP